MKRRCDARSFAGNRAVAGESPWSLGHDESSRDSLPYNTWGRVKIRYPNTWMLKETGEFGGLTDPMAAAAIFLPLEPNAIGI